MNKALAFALIAAVLAGGLASCQSSEEAKAARSRNPAPCPPVIVLADAARMIEFDGEADLERVAWTAEIERAEMSCRYFSDRPIEAELELSIAFGRGPAADALEKQFSYFVAVTRMDREVIAKETFAVPVKFSEKRNVRRVEQDIDEIVIPRASEEISGLNFEVIVGLVVTPEQAVYNRSGKSLKFPEL